VIALAACSSAAPPPPANQTQAAPGKPPAIAVQLAYKGSFGIGPPFSQVPPFTLLDDGTLIVANDEAISTVKLPRDELARIAAHVRALGFERLKSHTESCKRNSNGTGMCISDASYTIVRVALPSGELREVTSYAGFSNEPETLDKIVKYLEGYKAPRGTPYRPTRAAVHVSAENGAPEPSCPSIDPALLRFGTETPWAIILEGTELETLFAIGKVTRGKFTACAQGARFHVTIVPGVPGSDLSEELEPYKRLR
jgi:hypothetical protein